ncbi:MAG: 23S rRNA (adenine(2503)-C(2))-methyltransferase RlmN [Tannerellaceae bacterium]|jgi:23S rRNA (adenine2503-C2)-methyltransferase|nr:23S rRNA (adenine(2503)-C(2))-methyltransferase RlmN [Tannerellaceae bacterium]
MTKKRQLLGMTLEELSKIVVEAQLPSYATKQIADWIYKKKVVSIAEMTNIAAVKRAYLEKHFEIGLTPPASVIESADGTIKYLFPAAGSFVEAVYIPSDDRATVCVSSQVGCKMSCLFCMTGRQGFTANLTAGEIINQIQALPQADTLTNIVFMGMGEPLDNIGEVLKALNILTQPYGYGWSPKRITVSTIGTKGLKRFLDESTCHLAVSLHASNPNDRFSIMPAEKAFPLHQIISLIKQYDFSRQRRVSFEYIIFKGFNDSIQHAVSLSDLLKGIPCRINLIRYHVVPDTPLESADLKRMEVFRDMLNNRGILATIRTSRGEDIFAACGMLSTAKKM